MEILSTFSLPIAVFVWINLSKKNKDSIFIQIFDVSPLTSFIDFFGFKFLLLYQLQKALVHLCFISTFFNAN